MKGKTDYYRYRAVGEPVRRGNPGKIFEPAYGAANLGILKDIYPGQGNGSGRDNIGYGR